MDRRSTRTRLLILGAALSLCQAVPAAAPAPDLRAARWLAPEARAKALSQRPSECLALPTDPATRAAVEVGRAAFRTPLLLGGQAARAGLSCESCHRSGRDNPDFQFQGLSGAPGTADVTSSLMSSHRGNQRFDPKPIPDLVMPGKVSRAPASPALRTFIRGLVVEEFDGAEPPPRVLDGLADYVRALDRRACLGGAQAIKLEDQLQDLERANGAALWALRAGDRASARLMISAARTALGLIDERYALPGRDRHRRALRDADGGLLAIQQALDTDARDVETQMSAWQARSRGWINALRRDEARSLYSADRLRVALASSAR